MDSKRNHLRLIKRREDVSELEIRRISAEFNKLLLQSMCFGRYTEYLSLMESRRLYYKTGDISLMEETIRNHKRLIDLGPPSAKDLSRIRSSLTKITDRLNGLQLSEDSRVVVAELTRKLIKSIITENKKSLSHLTMLANNFRVSKNVDKLREDLRLIN